MSRCLTVRPSAAPREGFTVLVIDRDVDEAEAVCAGLREDGHVTDVRTYEDDLTTIIAEKCPQVIALRMRVGGGSRAIKSRLKKAFPHIQLITFSGADVDAVRAQLPRCWTELYELSAAGLPRPAGFPRAVRELLEDILCA